MKGLSFDKFIIERAETSGHKDAMKLGLEYKGGGYWNDPKTNKVTHQTIDGELQPYEGAAANVPDAGGPANAATLADKNPQQPGGQMAPPLGAGVGPAPEPGEETPNPMGANWSPGPDGDNCVEGQPAPDDLSFDMFVGKTNYYKWVAGSDGSNFKNLDFTKFTKDEEEKVEETIAHSYFTFLGEEELDVGNPTAVSLGGMSPSEKAAQMGLISNGNGSYRDKSGITVARTVNGELMFYDQGPGGGAVSDGAGGEQQATNQPSWQDPTTGQLMTPPAQPESPEEIAAVPDPIPATPPSGYDSFMNQKADEKRRQQIIQDEIDGKKAATDEKYAEAPLGKAFSARMDMFIDDMVNSDDEEEKAIGYHLMDVMADNVDSHVEALKTIRDDMKPGAVATLARMAEREARERYLLDLQGDEDATGDDNENEVGDNKELEDLRDEQQKEADKYEKEFGTEAPLSPARKAKEEEMDQISDDMDSLMEEEPTPENTKDLQDRMVEIQKMAEGKATDKTRQVEAKYAKHMEKVYEPVKNMIEKMDAKDQGTFIPLILNAGQYVGRPNRGVGLASLGQFDIAQMALAQKDLMSYNLDTKEGAEKFVQNRRIHKVDDEFVKLTYDLLPEKLRTAWKKKGNAAKKGTEYYDQHFMGYDEDGNEIRGFGKQERGLYIWKMYLEQGGIDAYTGLPLDIESIDLEHIVPGSSAKNMEDFHAIENSKNHVLVNANVNQSKKELPFNEFMEKRVMPLADKDQQFWDSRSELFDYANSVTTVEQQMMSQFVNDKGDIHENMTPELFMEIIENHEKGLKEKKSSLKKSVDMSDSDTSSVLNSAIPTQSNITKELISAFGLPRGYNKDKNVAKKDGGAQKERTNSFGSDNYYRGVFLSMAGKPKKHQDKIKQIYRDALNHASETGTRDKGFAEYMVKHGGIDIDAVSKYKDIANIYKSSYAEAYYHKYVSYINEDMKSFSVFMRKLNIKKGI